MSAEKICEDYLGVKLTSAKRNTHYLSKLVEILTAKKWSVEKIAEEIEIMPRTVVRYKAKKEEVPLSEEMQIRMKRYLKIEHVK
jgi:DNA-binding Xre family transcriptional regulator